MAENLTGIESTFCTSWEGWDEIDCGVLGFYDPVLKPEIQAMLVDVLGPVDFLVVDTQKNQVVFQSGEDERVFAMNVTLGKLL